MKLNLITIFLAFLVSNSAFAKLKFKDCNSWEIKTIKKHNFDAIEHGRYLLNEINDYLDRTSNKKYKSRVKRAHSVVSCTIKKLPKTKYKCSKNEKAKYVARTIPIIGRKVTLSPLFWKATNRYMVIALFHEATHKCATTDANYNYQSGDKPSSQGVIGWQNIATTYDYWVSFGFCIPNVDC